MMAAQAGFAQGVKSLFDEFKDAAKADYVHVPPVLMKLAAKSATFKEGDKEDLQAAEVIKKISSVTALDLEDCSSDIKQKFCAAVKTFADNNYEELLRSKEDGELTRIMLKKKGGKITELLVLSASDDDPSAVLIKGKIAEKDIDAIIKQNNE